MDRPTEQHRVSPEVALRLRYLELEDLAKSDMTKCDHCEAKVRRGNAIESWKGRSCIYVACLECLSSSGFLFVIYPDGLHIIPQKEAGVGALRSASSLLPSSSKPLHRGENKVFRSSRKAGQ